MKTIHNYYSNTPCLGKDCKYWTGEYEDVRVYPKGYDQLGLGHYNNEEFTSIWHGEHCNKNTDIGELRKSIYDRALEASDNIHKNNKYKNIGMEIRKAGEAFDKVADEWRNMRCPFYEVENDHKL